MLPKAVAQQPMLGMGKEDVDREATSVARLVVQTNHQHMVVGHGAEGLDLFAEERRPTRSPEDRSAELWQTKATELRSLPKVKGGRLIPRNRDQLSDVRHHSGARRRYGDRRPTIGK